MSSPTATATVTAGQTATYSINLASASGMSQSIALTCSGAPALATCTISPSTVQLSATAAVSGSVTLSTTAPKSGFVVPPWPLGTTNVEHRSPLRYSPASLVILFIAVLLNRLRTEQLNSVLAAGVLLVALCIAMSSCGGGSGTTSGGGTPPGNYMITVSATPSGTSAPAHSVTLALVVK